VAVLDVVVPDFLVRERLVRLGDLDISGIEALRRLILGGVWSDLVGVEAARQPLVDALDVLLARGLQLKHVRRE
jgi:hypothetical protein